jgi:hypothetical protein
MKFISIHEAILNIQLKENPEGAMQGYMQKRLINPINALVDAVERIKQSTTKLKEFREHSRNSQEHS